MRAMRGMLREAPAGFPSDGIVVFDLSVGRLIATYEYRTGTVRNAACNSEDQLDPPVAPAAPGSCYQLNCTSETACRGSAKFR